MQKSNATRVTILVDNESWILPYAEGLVQELSESGFDAKLVRAANDIRNGWVCFLLGCIKLIGPQQLQRNSHNLVVHESDLPKGRGFAPMAWQIIEGKNSIPICLLEASEDEPDAGDIWLRDSIELEGDELLPRWRHLQGKKTVELCMRFVREYESLQPIKQSGEGTWYPRRRPEDSEIDPELTIREQFGLLRVVDNERYPAFFYIDGHKVVLRVEEGQVNV